MDSRLTTKCPESVPVITNSPRYRFPFHTTKEFGSGVTTSVLVSVDIEGSRTAVASAIRTIWSLPFLKLPRTTGTFPLPAPGELRDTHAPNPSTLTIATAVIARTRMIGLRNCLLQRSAHSLERRRDFSVAVGRGHETGFEW